jgi:ABC-type Fe3+ transport system permease subunit
MPTDSKWLVVGSLLIALLSSLLILQRAGDLLTPAPFYLIILAWIVSYGFVLFLPIIYILFTSFASRSNKFTKNVLILVLVLALLDSIYFYTAWDYGVTWQGQRHTVMIAIINLFVFILVTALSVWAQRNRNKNGAHFSSLCLFLFLSWGAFPYLGEYP